MKHNFLRRLGALALTFALALSLTVTPAWAADAPNTLRVEAMTLSPNGAGVPKVIFTNDNGLETELMPDRYQLTVDSSNPVNTPLIITVDDSTGMIRSSGVEGSNVVTVKYGSWSGNIFTQDTNVTPVTFLVSVIGEAKPNPLKIVVDAPGAIMAPETEADCIGIMLAAGGTANLSATVTGDKSEVVSVSWTVTENPGVASCEYDRVNDDKNAVVTALRNGTAVIEARLHEADSSGTVLGTFKIKVYVGDLRMEVRNEDVTSRPLINNERIELAQDKTLTVSAAVIDEVNATHRDNITWTSSDSSIVSVTSGSNGRATLKAAADNHGQVTITASRGGVSASFSVVVPEPGAVRVQSVTLDKSELGLSLNEAYDLVVRVLPSNADQRVKWESDDPTVAEVDDKGRVIALKVGTATITVTSVYDSTRKAECKVTVSPGLTSLTILDKTSTGVLNLNASMSKPGGTQNVQARVGPTNAYYNSIEWTSDNPKVATIRKDDKYPSGLFAILTAVSPGEATITVQCGNVKDTAKVTIPGLVIESGVLTMTDGKLTMKEGATEQLSYKGYGAAANLGSTSVPNWISSDSSVVDVDRITGALNARKAGTATITLNIGNYEATCQVTVAEDTEGIITLTGNYPAGSPINMNTARGTSDAASGALPSVMSAISNLKTGAGLSYITNLSVASTEQGILHDEHHSADDTGAGVGISDRYYINANTAQGQRPLSDLSFVPRTTFNGTAEITFTGWSTTRQPFNGTIRISVNGTGDVMYSSGDGSPVSFVASDFNLYHPNLRSVSFTPPQESVGTLYYNYTSASQPGTKVTASTLYNRTGTPSIDKVTFVPAANYEGTVKISYKGTDTSGRSFTGVVTITVTKAGSSGGNAADISYSTKEDSWITFRPSDFNTASLRTLGESLSYVRFTPPASSEGTLFYNYRGFSDFDSMVNSTTSYYYSGNPALSGVSFVPTTTTPGQVDIEYTGYTVRGNTFTGTIHIGLNDDPPEQQLLHYTVFTGRTVSLSASDFNSACMAATGASLNSIQFTSLPGVSQGNLRYTRGNSSTPYNVTTGTRFYRTSSAASANLIGSVYFQANANYTGTLTIPFTGTSDNGTTFTDEVVITVTPPTATDVTYSGTTASPIRLYASRIQSANSDVLSNVSYITFTSLPGSTAGKLYVGYSGFGTGTQVSTGTRYYVSGYPSIDQISFVPRGRFSGQASVGYTATSSNGQSVSGRIVFSISSTGNSSYFSDMASHTWAAPSVDYLYQNGVTNGITATSYGPNRQILRCDFVLMVCRAFGFTGGSGYSFADVPTSAYFAQAVATAKQMGIVSGDGRNFKPYSPITRQDAMVIVDNAMRAAGWNVGNASGAVLNQFSDSGSVSSYARSAVSTLVQLGAVNGSDGRLLPHNPITRAEAAVILHFVMTM